MSKGSTLLCGLCRKLGPETGAGVGPGARVNEKSPLTSVGGVSGSTNSITSCSALTELRILDCEKLTVPGAESEMATGDIASCSAMPRLSARPMDFTKSSAAEKLISPLGDKPSAMETSVSILLRRGTASVCGRPRGTEASSAALKMRDRRVRCGGSASSSSDILLCFWTGVLLLGALPCKLEALPWSVGVCAERCTGPSS
mmetsp:Transcript_48223/g.90321  ORF Transcript_48223/g.90321 Transcript_48223/m.90321 type:complete len:201 (-) Transcript_48223:1058-1660(-)